MSSSKTPRGARAKSPSASRKSGATEPGPTEPDSSGAAPPAPAADPTPLAADAAPSPPPAADATPAGPDPVPPGIRGLVELFRGDLAEVRFPDVDREVLEGACDAVRAADAEVTRLFAELEAAQTALASERSKLGKLAERGLAYARVFAGEDEVLNAKLDALDLGTPKKPGRKGKPKAKTSSASKTGGGKSTPALVQSEDAPPGESDKKSA